MQEKKLSEIDEAAMEEELEVLNLSVMKRYIFFRKVGCQWIAESFRLIPAENVSGDIYCVLTNIFDLEPDFIVLIYRKRWDIEVLLRFIKQELNSHFMLTNKIGIKIILYKTLILSMLILIYKRINYGYCCSIMP